MASWFRMSVSNACSVGREIRLREGGDDAAVEIGLDLLEHEGELQDRGVAGREIDHDGLAARRQSRDVVRGARGHEARQQHERAADSDEAQEVAARAGGVELGEAPQFDAHAES